MAPVQMTYKLTFPSKHVDNVNLCKTRNLFILKPLKEMIPSIIINSEAFSRRRDEVS